MQRRFNVRKVAVLGAGVMGAQIAAHLVNVRVPVILFDLPAKDKDGAGAPSANFSKNGIVTRAVENLKKLKPAPLGIPEDAVFIEQANYEEHLDRLLECDLVIEAIAERMDWKLDLYTKVAPKIAPHAIIASNTSGLSITKLSEVLPEQIKSRFCGIHFFNPPRYMALVELIATPTTDPQILDDLEAFVTTALGKSVVRAKDTPNFIANRVGIAGMLATMKEAETFGLTYDVVDDLTGKKLGRASSGTFRTADVVGLDTMAHVIKTLQDNLGPEQGNDPFFASFATPAVLQKLLDAGALGQKTGAGFYKKVGKDILRFDAGKGDYVRGRRQGRRDRRAHAEEAAGRAPQAAARLEEPAGAVPLGDPARQLPLRGHPSRRRRRERARHRLRDALGLRHEPGAVRALAAGRLGAGRAMGEGRHRQRPRARESAAAGVGVRRPGRRARRRAPARRLVERVGAALRSATGAAGLCAPAVPRQRVRIERSGAAEGRQRGLQERRGPRLDARRRGADREHHRQAAPHQPGGDRRAAEGGRARRTRLPGRRHLVARRRLLGRRQPRGADAPVHEERRQGHRSRSEEDAGRDAAHPLRHGSGRRCGARNRSRRRLRDRHPQRAPRRRDRELHGLRRGRRRSDPGWRRPRLRRAPRGRDGVGRQRQRRPDEVPQRRLHQRRAGEGQHERDREQEARLPARRATSSSRTRTSCCTSRRSRSRR